MILATMFSPTALEVIVLGGVPALYAGYRGITDGRRGAPRMGEVLSRMAGAALALYGLLTLLVIYRGEDSASEWLIMSLFLLAFVAVIAGTSSAVAYFTCYWLAVWLSRPGEDGPLAGAAPK